MFRVRRDANEVVLHRSRHDQFAPITLFIALLAICLAIPQSASAAPQPVAAYSFDDGSGSTLTDSAGDNDGAIEGATWTSSGKYGAALEFDGENDLVSIAHAAELDLTDAFTLEAWVRPDSLTTLVPVLGKATVSEESYYGYSLTAKGLGAGPAGFVADNEFVGATGSAALPTGEWSHLAFTSDGETLSLFVDGEPAGTKPAIDAATTAASLAIGHSGSTSTSYFHGMIDEVRLYDEPRSEDQIQTDRDTAVGLDQMPVAAYSFDEGEGEILGDSAGDNDGMIEGATWTSEGKYGSALEFDGENDLVSIAHAAELDLTDAFTLEAWVRPDSLSLWSPVISKGKDSGSGTEGFLLTAQFFGKPAGYVADSSGESAGAWGTSQLPTDGSWAHLAFASDGSQLSLYVDGEVVGTESALEAGANTEPLLLGHDQTFSTYFHGMIDEVRLYDEPLSETRIQTDRDNRVEPPPATEVTTTALDTGENSELVESVPITTEGEETTAYSLEVPSLEAGEVLRITANLELTNDQSYDVTDSVRIVLGSNETDANGEVVVPWTSITHTPEMRHWTFPISGAYHATEELGTQYLKVIVKAQSEEAEASDALILQQNFGSLAAVRSTPAPGPMSQPTHQLQPQLDSIPLAIDTLPVDSTWRRVATRKASSLSDMDTLTFATQFAVHSSDGEPVRLETKITRTTEPTTAGSWAAPLAADQLSDDMPSIRVTHANYVGVDPGKPYLNVVMRAIPLSGSPQPLTIDSSASTMDVLRHASNPGDPLAPLGTGTRLQERADLSPEVSSIPYAVPGGSEKRVVASASVYDPFRKNEIIRARGMVTATLGNTEEVTQVLTRLVLADSPTATTGQTIGAFSGDKLPPSANVHTSVKEGVHTFSAVEGDNKYVNLVVYASQAEPSGSMAVNSAYVYLALSEPTAPMNEGFEDVAEGDQLNSLLEFEFNGELSASSTVAREGSKSLLVDVNNLNDYPGAPSGVRRVEARHPDLASSGARVGGESWYGFSVYFPESFNAPDPGLPPHYKGLIDEVRLYDEALSQEQIAADRDGEYGAVAPVAAYTFSEGSGAVAGDSAGEHHGTLIGNPTWSEAGKYGSALFLDGSDDEVRIPDAPALDFTDHLTLEAWLQPSELRSLVPAISKLDGLVGYGLLPAFWDESGAPGAPLGFVGGSMGLGTVAGSEKLPTGTWSHLALTSDGTDLKLYVNGSLVESSPAIDAEANDAELALGGPSLFAGKVGTWNIITQWKGTNDISEIGCGEETALSPAVALGVRSYKAGAHTNPGETETATPTDGEYLEVRFNGGEVNENCDGTIEPTATYVIAPIENSRWYDIVQRTEWTPSNGSPEDSNLELWVDGKEVLGDGTLSVEKPTLFWRGNTGNSTTGAFPQFGIYRGPSSEDPTSSLYIDAIRSGDSFSEVAPGQ